MSAMSSDCRGRKFAESMGAVGGSVVPTATATSWLQSVVVWSTTIVFEVDASSGSGDEEVWVVYDDEAGEPGSPSGAAGSGVVSSGVVFVDPSSRNCESGWGVFTTLLASSYIIRVVGAPGAVKGTSSAQAQASGTDTITVAILPRAFIT